MDNCLIFSSLVTSVNSSPAETLTCWQVLRDAWQFRLKATSDDGDRLLLLCGLSVADRMIWQLRRDAEAGYQCER